MVSLCHMANNLGMVQPAEAVGKICRKADVLYMLDAANTAGIIPINVDEIGCDFLVVSGRKYLRGPADRHFCTPGHPRWKKLSRYLRPGTMALGIGARKTGIGVKPFHPPQVSSV